MISSLMESFVYSAARSIAAILYGAFMGIFSTLFIKRNGFQLVAHWELVEGVRREMEAVRRGFESIINISDLSSFTPDEVCFSNSKSSSAVKMFLKERRDLSGDGIQDRVK